jgi:hypothetical protein
VDPGRRPSVNIYKIDSNSYHAVVITTTKERALKMAEKKALMKFTGERPYADAVLLGPAAPDRLTEQTVMEASVVPVRDDTCFPSW